MKFVLSPYHSRIKSAIETVKDIEKAVAAQDGVLSPEDFRARVANTVRIYAHNEMMASYEGTGDEETYVVHHS